MSGVLSCCSDLPLTFSLVLPPLHPPVPSSFTSLLSNLPPPPPYISFLSCIFVLSPFHPLPFLCLPPPLTSTTRAVRGLVMAFSMSGVWSRNGVLLTFSLPPSPPPTISFRLSTFHPHLPPPSPLTSTRRVVRGLVMAFSMSGVLSRCSISFSLSPSLRLSPLYPPSPHYHLLSPPPFALIYPPPPTPLTSTTRAVRGLVMVLSMSEVWSCTSVSFSPSPSLLLPPHIYLLSSPPPFTLLCLPLLSPPRRER